MAAKDAEALVVQLLQQEGQVEAQPPEWYHQLKAAVNDLINHDFDALLQLLYRVDVSESKIRKMLSDFPATDAASVITNLLLERQLQKIKSRQTYQSPPADNEEDAW